MRQHHNGHSGNDAGGGLELLPICQIGCTNGTDTWHILPLTHLYKILVESVGLDHEMSKVDCDCSFGPWALNLK
jgi:hypothetical protein